VASEEAVATSEGDLRVAWIGRATRNLADTWEHVAQVMDAPWERWPAGWASDLGSACPFLNNTTLVHPLEVADVTALVARLHAFFGGREGGSSLLWSGWPTPDLAPVGYNFWGQPPLMVRSPGGSAPAPPAGLAVAEATTAAALADFERVLVDGYPAPWLQPFRPGCAFDARVLGGPFRFWVGYVDDQPVSCSAAFVDTEVVGVSMVATLPAERGKGYGTALTWAATVAAPELPAVLLASDEGRPIYERLGYEIVSRFNLWECPRPRPAPDGPGASR
jgi:GNAT superfamily N-acetyltransferase